MLNDKIKSIPALKQIIRRLQKRGKKVVFTNGCFDLLHVGHIQYLEDARRQGDALVVAVNSDASVRRLKGKQRPIVPQEDRIRIIAGLQSVDYACLFTEDTPQKVIEQLRPDILVKGADWKHKGIAGASFVRSCGGRVLTIPLIKNRSTSRLIEKIAQSCLR